MYFSAAVFAAITLALPALSSTTGPPAHGSELNSSQGTGRYIVRFKDLATKANVLGKLSAKARMQVTHEWDIIHGFAGNFDSETLEALRSSPDVAGIHPDGVMYPTHLKTQQDAPWGLSRLSSDHGLEGDDNALNFQYTYDSAAGAGVDIYIVDSGILTTHKQFGGRARWGKTFASGGDHDVLGHGTHCSGVAASNQFGVAKAANLIAVKILGDAGTGSSSDIISGLNWIANETAHSRRPSVVSMSIGGEADQSLDDAVNAIVDKGIHVVSAGNDETDAANSSPARAAGAITVGASTIFDTRASFSNFGAPVAIWAPGEDIISTWIDDNTATMSLSGTSMACPHVTGLIAYLISVDGNLHPADMKAKLQRMGLKDVLSDIPSGTVNILAHNARP